MTKTRTTFTLATLSMAVALSFNTLAATVTVAPGLDTLRTAINASSDGDILILEDGLYQFTKTIEVPHSLTIRAVNELAEPIVYSSLYRGAIEFTGEQSKYHIQGITFSSIATTAAQYMSLNIAGDLNNFTFLENKLIKQVDLATPYVTDEDNKVLLAENVFVVGNAFYGHEGHIPYISLKSDNLALFSGNIVSQASLTVNANNNAETYVMGNNFITYKHAYYRFNDNVNVIANTFERHLAFNGDSASSQVINSNIALAGNAVFSNNLVKVGVDNFNTAGTPRNYSYITASSLDSAIITNNVFHQVGKNGSSEESYQDVAAFNFIPTLFANNVIMGTSNKLFSDEDTLEVPAANNICFDNFECPASLALTVDPVLDSTSYTPLSGSPVINTGINEIIYRDLDGSRNDIGIYGGPQSFSRYATQRSAVGPYIYSLFNANKSLSNTGQLKVKVAAFAKQR